MSDYLSNASTRKTPRDPHPGRLIDMDGSLYDADDGASVQITRLALEVIRLREALATAESRAAEAEALVERLVAAWPTYTQGNRSHVVGVLLDMHADRDGHVWTRIGYPEGDFWLGSRHPDRRSAILAATRGDENK